MEGGLLVTDDTEIDHLARTLRNHGWTRDVPADTTIYEKGEDSFSEAYRFILPGYNVRPLEVSSAIGLEQINKLDRLIEARRQNAELFVRLFRGDARFVIQRENGRSSWFSFTIILNPGLRIDRGKVMATLRQADIGFRMITGGCFLRHDVIKFFDYDTAGEIVNANIAHDRGFFVGNHSADLAPQIRRFRDVLDRVVPEP
jgi:CDP-6-deoxy-D-xylo-4-hexulose-3-dehydrase